MKRLSVVKFLVLAVFFSLLVIPIQAQAQDKVITLKVTNWFPIAHKQTPLLESWCKELEKRTNGKVKVNYYPAATLVPAVQTYDAVTKGIADVGNHVLGYTVGRFPLMEVLDLPLGYPKDNKAPTKLMNAFYAKFKPKELDDVKVLWIHGQAPGIIHTKTKPINKLEDLKGVKMRTYGSNAKLVSLLGATPVAMPMTDVYDALSRGVMDGVMAAYEALEGFRLGEQVKYDIENYATAYSAVFLVMMNKAKWNALSPDIQKIVDDMSKEYIEKYAIMWDDIEKSGRAYMQKRGSTVITLSKEEEVRWVEKARPILDEYVKKMKEKGLPGEEALKFAQDYLKSYKK